MNLGEPVSRELYNFLDFQRFRLVNQTINKKKNKRWKFTNVTYTPNQRVDKNVEV